MEVFYIHFSSDDWPIVLNKDGVQLDLTRTLAPPHIFISASTFRTGELKPPMQVPFSATVGDVSWIVWSYWPRVYNASQDISIHQILQVKKLIAEHHNCRAAQIMIKDPAKEKILEKSKQPVFQGKTVQVSLVVHAQTRIVPCFIWPYVSICLQIGKLQYLLYDFRSLKPPNKRMYQPY